MYMGKSNPELKNKNPAGGLIRIVRKRNEVI